MRATLTMLMLFFAGIGSAADRSTEASPCPGLVSSYDTESFDQLLVVTDAEFASIEDCERLGRFYFNPAQASERSMDYAQLGAIVDAIWRPANEEAPNVLLEAFLSWLKALDFDEHTAALREFIGTYLPANESLQLFFNLLVWLIVLATAMLVVREFYRAGMFRVHRRRGRRAQDGEPARSTVQSWEAILALPAREQIGALLKYSLEQLAAAGKIPVSRSYTNRELVEHLVMRDAHKAGLLRQQVEVTEPVIYGDERATAERLAACRRYSRELAGA